MSKGKPPSPPNRTILGMPSDVQAALDKLQAQPNERRPAGPAAPTTNPPAPNPKLDLQSTLYGNPHGQSQAAEQPTQPAVPLSPERTILGMPSDVEAALRQLQARANPQPAAPLTRSNDPAASQAWPPAAESANVWGTQPTAATPPPLPSRAASARPTSQPAAASAPATHSPAPAAPSQPPPPSEANHGLPREARFDPMTGKPLYPEPPREARFDPMTGKPLRPSQPVSLQPSREPAFDPMTGKPLRPSQSLPVQPSRGFDPAATVTAAPQAPREPARFDPAATVSPRVAQPAPRVEGPTVSQAPVEVPRPAAQAPRFDPAATLSLRRPQVTSARASLPPRSSESRPEPRSSRSLQTTGAGLAGAPRQQPGSPLAASAKTSGAVQFVEGAPASLGEPAAVSGEAALARPQGVAEHAPAEHAGKRAGTARSGVHPSVNSPLASEPAAPRPAHPLAGPSAPPRAVPNPGPAAVGGGGSSGRSTQAAARATGIAPRPPLEGPAAPAKAPEPKSATASVPVEKAKAAPPKLPTLEPSASAARSSLSGLFGGNPNKVAMDATEPDRERSSPNSPSSAAKSELSQGLGAPAASGGPLLGGAPAGGMLATRLVPLEQEGSGGKVGGLKLNSSDLPVTGSSTIEPLALNLNTPAHASKPPVRRWPALALLGLAVVAFGGVIVVRAPGLLPPPIAAVVVPWVAPLVAQFMPQVQGAPPPTPAITPPVQGPQPEAVPTQEAAPAQPGPAVEPQVPSQAAENPPPSAEANPQQVAAAQAGTVKGGSAQLEKQAIDALIANDYRAAYALYEKLRAAEPAHPEYGVMLELLTRELSPACGGPGQAACPAP